MSVYNEQSRDSRRQAIEGLSIKDAALSYARDLGWPVLPLKPGAKEPLTAHGVKDASDELEQIAAWWRRWPEANVGLACGASRRVVLDFDVAKEGYAGAELLDRLLREMPTVASRTGGGGWHLFFRVPDGAVIGNSRGRLPLGVDVRGAGGYVVLPPSVHPSGQRYAWAEGCSPEEQVSRTLPGFVLEHIKSKSAHADAGPKCARAAGNRSVGLNLERARSALEHLAPWHCDDYESWLQVGMALSELGADGLPLWESWSRRSKRYEAGVCQAKWKTFKPGAGIGLGSLFHWAEEDSGGLFTVRVGPEAAPDEDAAPEKNKVVKGAAKSQEKKQPPKQADMLYRLARAELDLFTSPEGVVYAFARANSVRSCLRVRSELFENYLTALYYRQSRSLPSKQAKTDAQAMLEWKARGNQQEVCVRVGGHSGRVYLDLGTASWEAVEVDGDGWRVVKEPPVAFWRPRGLEALPMPVRCSEPWRLQQFINVGSADWPLVSAWIMAALHPAGPYPVLALLGEQGTAKSTTLRVLKSLIDPGRAGLRGQPADIRDLMVGAANSWLLAYDNISVIQGEISDALCRVATGGGFAKRQLFTDDEEVLIDVMRPIALNGIGDVVTRPDLMDRALLIVPPVIPEERRRDEATFWREFEAARPELLGSLLGALSVALKRLPEVRLPRLPRMADFAKLAVAAEEALCPAGSVGFLSAYERNRSEATESVIDASPLGDALRQLVRADNRWEGSASDLLEILNQRVSESTKRSRGWPAAPNRMRSHLQRLAPSLRRLGVSAVYTRDRARSHIVIERMREDEK